jgi:hypothetical protein
MSEEWLCIICGKPARYKKGKDKFYCNKHWNYGEPVK